MASQPARTRAAAVQGVKVKSWAIAASLLAMGVTTTGAALAAPASARTPLTPPSQKQRLIVLTDVGAEADDTMSLVRLMLYSNEIDIEGLVATTSIWIPHERHPEMIRDIVDRYGQVRSNLLLHESGYPEAAALRSKIVEGQRDYGLAAVGAGKESAGADMIIKALDAPDPRPLWVTAWGGANTLAQALTTLRSSRSPEDLKRLVAKLRVYTISDQDDSGAWIRKEFPDLCYIVSPGPYGNATWTGMNEVVESADNTTISNAWLAANIQQGHGALGAAYPDVAWGTEGDTPSFLGLIPNGLSVPDHPDFGGWGGRYELYTPSVEGLGATVTGGIPLGPETRPIWSNAVDSYTPYLASNYGRAVKPASKTFKDFKVTLWRWRDDFQNDFAARMAWTTQPFDKANHPPVVHLDTPERLTAHSGELFTLSAIGSWDPDGDSLSYLWFSYPEAGSWKTPVELVGPENTVRVNFRAPSVTRSETAHLILKVTDKGSPPLTRYKRIIVTLLPAK
jgi:hypothetical protein